MARPVRSGCEHDPIDACDRPAVRRRDRLLAFGAALVLSDAFDAALYSAFGRHAMLLPGLPVSRILLTGVFAATAVLLAGDLRGAVSHARAAWFVWPAVVLALLSTLWSDRPATTILWAAALLATSAFGVALAARFSAIAQARLTAVVGVTVALSSTFLALVWPAMGVGPSGDWRGVYVHKNLLGRVLALGVTATAVAAANGWRRLLAAGGLLLCGGALVLTHSRASQLAVAIASAAAMLLLAARRWRRHGCAILASGAVVIGLGAAFLVGTKPGLALLARSPTWTERTRIWSRVAAGVSEAPWLGHGYGAFWPGPAGAHALADIRMPISQAHNGALDLAAELGVVGLALVLVPLGFVALGALRHALDPRIGACLWPAVYVVFFAVSNAGESPILRHKLAWALYVAVACHVAGRGSAGEGAEPRLLNTRPDP